MDKNIILKIFFGLFFLSLQVNAQLSTREVPVGFNYDENMFRTNIKNLETLPPIDLLKLKLKE